MKCGCGETKATGKRGEQVCRSTASASLFPWWLPPRFPSLSLLVRWLCVCPPLLAALPLVAARRLLPVAFAVGLLGVSCGELGGETAPLGRKSLAGTGEQRTPADERDCFGALAPLQGSHTPISWVTRALLDLTHCRDLVWCNRPLFPFPFLLSLFRSHTPPPLFISSSHVDSLFSHISSFCSFPSFHGVLSFPTDRFRLSS